MYPSHEDQEVELLSRVDLFESLSEEEIRDLLRQNSEVRLGEGETFYAPWEQGGKLFILKKGRMRLYRTEGGREFTLEVVDAGTVFGEMAFTPHRLRESYARAMEPSVVFVIERAEVERLIEEKPQVGIRMISLLSERLHYYETRVEDITLKEVPVRPEKVESGGVSQVVEGERRTRQVSDQDDKDAGQPRLLFDLCILQAGADEARNVDEPLRAAISVVGQGGSSRLRGATKPPTRR